MLHMFATMEKDLVALTSLGDIGFAENKNVRIEYHAGQKVGMINCPRWRLIWWRLRYS